MPLILHSALLASKERTFLFELPYLSQMNVEKIHKRVATIMRFSFLSKSHFGEIGTIWHLF